MYFNKLTFESEMCVGGAMPFLGKTYIYPRHMFVGIFPPIPRLGFGVRKQLNQAGPLKVIGLKKIIKSNIHTPLCYFFFFFGTRLSFF